MIIRGLLEQQLTECAENVGVNLYNIRKSGRGFRFQLKLKGEEYRRYSNSGRKVAAVCWHGHRDFFREVYDINSQATIITMLARYENSEHFEQIYPTTGNTNIGSIFNPLSIQNACQC